MEYTEEEFFRLAGAADYFRSELVFAWFDWRQKQGLEWNPKGQYNVKYDYKTDEIVATSERFGEDRFPATEIYTPNPDKVKMLWFCGYYDGPLDGVGEYKDKKVWFEIREHTYDNLFNVWVYEVYELTDDQYEKELKHHKGQKRFFERKFKRPDYSKTNKSLGLFDDCLMERCYDR